VGAADQKTEERMFPTHRCFGSKYICRTEFAVVFLAVFVQGGGRAHERGPGVRLGPLPGERQGSSLLISLLFSCLVVHIQYGEFKGTEMRDVLYIYHILTYFDEKQIFVNFA
jgi:hypothetical protein